ncbi:MAG: metallophosphoesterase [Syntrophobacteraceae bacterium]
MTTGLGDLAGPADTLLLLHLSDIHFEEPYCLNPETDQERPVRQALLNDVEKMVNKLGPVDAILVSGDIAFKGHSEEFKAATEWLLEAARVANCPRKQIYTVPGNHDVVREIAGNRTVQGARRMITEHEPGSVRDKEFHKSLLHEESGIILLRPLAEYNLFAASFGCDLLPGQPFWIQELTLAPGWRLRMYGLTTTILSGPDDDVKGKLYLGALQRAFAAYDGVIYLVVLHHPPDWLADCDELDDALWNSCALQLLGHKHRQRHRPGPNGVRLSAGAVNPSRTDGSWEPGYNLIKLQMIEDRGKHSLSIESHLRIWQNDPDRFVPKKNQDDAEVFVDTVIIRSKPSLVFAKDVEEPPPMNIAENETGTPGTLSSTAVLQGTQRDLVFDFWQLSPSQRRKIMQSLNLLEKSDDQLSETQRYRLAFRRAQERGMIQKVEGLINLILNK